MKLISNVIRLYVLCIQDSMSSWPPGGGYDDQCDHLLRHQVPNRGNLGNSRTTQGPRIAVIADGADGRA